MSTSPLSSRSPSLTTIHGLLALQTVVVLLGSLNRLGPWTAGYVAPNEFLRWVDLLNMLPIAMLSVSASGGLFVALGYDNGRFYGRRHAALGLAFLLGVNYGDHEVTNYLNSRFCIGSPLAGAEDLCRIVAYNDDEFSHYLFFAAFVVINLALMVMQALFPHKRRALAGRDMALLGVNGLFIALGVAANLGFEEIGFVCDCAAGAACGGVSGTVRAAAAAGVLQCGVLGRAGADGCGAECVIRNRE